MDDEQFIPEPIPEEPPTELKDYQSPTIRDWGTIAELTQASANSPTDGFGGSQPP